MNKRGIARAVAMGLLIAEGAVADYVLLQMVRNGITIEVDNVEAVGELVKGEIEEEGEEMLEEAE